MKLVIDIAAKNAGALENAAVTSITDATPVAVLPDLELGDSEPIDLTFTDSSSGTPTVPSWAGQSNYTVALSLGTLDVNGLNAKTSSTSFTPQTNGWTGRLALDTQNLIDAVALQVGYSVDMSRFPGGITPGRPIQSLPRNGWFFLQIQVIDPSGNAITYAVLRLRVYNRVRPVSAGTDTTSTAAIYAWMLANATLNATLTGIASNVANTSLLCGLTTAGAARPVGCKILASFGSNIEALFELVATTSSSTGFLFQPYDYNATTNAYKWRLRGVWCLGVACIYNAGTGLWHTVSAVGADGSATIGCSESGFALPS